MPKSARYHLFLLGLWPEGEAGDWRFSLENPRTAERTGFGNLDELTQFIQRWMQASAQNLAEGQPHQEQNMERRVINPWTWQDNFGYVQANAVSGAQRVLYCSGQTANDADGNPMHAGDMPTQITLTLDNLEKLLTEAGFAFKDIVRLNIYTTDVDKFLENYETFITRLAGVGCRHAGSLVGVQRLAYPEMMLEIEATAVA